MPTQRDHPSFVRTVDTLVGVPLAWIVGRDRPDRPRRAGDAPRSIIDGALGEALCWLGLAPSRKGRHGRR